jgi:dolichyl-phosphate-mannose--protein O-mannosyl transferase
MESFHQVATGFGYSKQRSNKFQVMVLSIGIMCLVLSYILHYVPMNIKVQRTLDLFDNTPGLEATPLC